LRFVRASGSCRAVYEKQAPACPAHLNALVVRRGMQSFRGELSRPIGVTRLHQLKRGHRIAVVFDEKLEGVHRSGDRPCILRTRERPMQALLATLGFAVCLGADTKERSSHGPKIGVSLAYQPALTKAFISWATASTE